jgi:hypothetical protein
MAIVFRVVCRIDLRLHVGRSLAKGHVAFRHTSADSAGTTGFRAPEPWVG